MSVAVVVHAAAALGVTLARTVAVAAHEPVPLWEVLVAAGWTPPDDATVVRAERDAC